jgi:nicotinate-nucleotide adenylyltransferase
MERVGLFGGSFNPIHYGHLLMARAALEELNLSRLFFIPAAQSPFKPEAGLAPGSERLRLLRLALAGETQCEVDDQEIGRGGISYSVNTAREYAARFPGAELWYLIGADHARLLPKWRAAEELASLVQFAVVPRPGEPPEAVAPPFRCRWLRGWSMAISASEIRERVRGSRPIEGLVPPMVAEAIHIYRLYL